MMIHPHHVDIIILCVSLQASSWRSVCKGNPGHAIGKVRSLASRQILQSTEAA